MILILTEFIIENPHPLEIDLERIPLSFQLSIPSNMNENTIPIVVLHGYGDYANSPYMNSLHESMTKKHNVAIITVNYVGTFSNVSFDDKLSPYEFLNTTFVIEEGDNKKSFINILRGINNNDQNLINFLYEQKAIMHKDFRPYTRTIQLLIIKIESDICDAKYIYERIFEIGFNKGIATFVSSTKGDHNDFGVIQTIDVLTAIVHIKTLKKYHNISWDKLSVIGSSHGGYLASMCAKFAPNTFQTVINNAGWVQPNEEVDILCKYPSNTYFNTLVFSNKRENYWSDEQDNINYFSHNHRIIRSLDVDIHLKEQYKQSNQTNICRYIFSHTNNDTLISIDEKDQFIVNFNKYFNNTQYIRLDNKEQLDGKTFKSLDHGAKVSLKGLIIDYIINNKYNKQIDKNDFDLKSSIQYTCDDGYYLINYNSKYPKISFHKQ